MWVNKTYYNTSPEEFIVANFNGGSIEYIESTGTILESKHIGYHGFWGFFNENNSTVYFHDRIGQEHSRVISLDSETGDRSVIFEDSFISNCVHDKLNNLILISSFMDNTIHIVSPDPANPPELDYIILHTENARCLNISITEGNKLYCISYVDSENSVLEIWDLTNFTYQNSIHINDLISQSGELTSPKTDFYSDPVTHRTWITINGIKDDEIDGLICIDNNNTCTYLETVVDPGKICNYNYSSGNVYFLSHKNKAFSIYNAPDNDLTIHSFVNEGVVFHDLEYSSHSDYIYISVRDLDDDPYSFISEIWVYNCLLEEFLDSKIKTYGYPTALKYSPNINSLYILTPHNQSDNNQMEILRFDEINHIIDRICFGRYESAFSKLPVSDIVINPVSNELYLCSGYSEINVIEEDHGCIEENYLDYTIEEQTIWGDDKFIEKYIHIENGGSLTINNGATIYFKTNAKIVVNPGGKLIIDNATLTKACTGYWAGIEVWGTGIPYETQFSDVDGNYIQGYVELKNQATIKYAQCALLVAKRDFPAELQTINFCGGIIFSENTIFKNNIVAVELYPFINHHPVTQEEFRYFASFNDCRFVLDENHQYKINDYHHHVMLNGVDGIHFNNCQFEIQNTVDELNSVPDNFVYLKDCEEIRIKSCDFWNDMLYADFPALERGTGVYSVNTTLTIEGICIEQGQEDCITWDNSSFEGLAYGVVASNGRMMIPLTIEHTDFEDNARAVLLSGIQPSEITSNSFTLSEGFSSDTDTIIGLFLYHCNAYHVEGNTVTGNLDLIETDSLIGFVAESATGGANEIYNNSFDDLNVGIESIGDNRTNGGLCLKCNDFEGNNHDIYAVVDNRFEECGMAPEQGIQSSSPDATLPAGNTFSSSTAHMYDINNEAGHVLYIYHGDNPTSERIIPDLYEGNLDSEPNPNTYYSKDLACPSKLGGSGNPGTAKSSMSNNVSKADSLQTELDALVDGGDTDDLTIEVTMSFPDEALELRQQLLDESPYLSDTVMKSAIYKEDVLPNAMVRDVLVANPQSAKSGEVMEALDDRWDPMPGYMRDEIMVGKDSVGSKEIMEGQIRGYIHRRKLAFNQLVRNYMHDTVNDWAKDSLVTLLQNETDINAQYMLAFYYFNSCDTALMNSTLNNIPATFTLNSKQQQTHLNFLDYVDVLTALQYDTINNHHPDSTQLVTLFSLADTVNDLPSLYSRNMLIHLEMIDYKEKVFFPDPFKSSEILEWPENEYSLPESGYLYVYPNPAGDYFIVEYACKQPYIKAILTIYDIKGKIVNSLELTGKINQTVIPTGEMNNGIYLVSFYVDNNLIESKKITLLK